MPTISAHEAHQLAATLHQSGLAAIAGGRQADAVHWLSAAVANAPFSAEYHCDLGVVFRLVGRNEEAVRAFRRSVELEPKRGEAWSNLSDACLVLGQIEDAVQCGTQAVAETPENAIAHNNLGNALKASGRIEDAVAHFREAVRINPLHQYARTNLVAALIETDHPDEAILNCKQALAISPRAEHYHNLGAAHMARREVEMGIRFFQQAIELRPDFAYAHWHLGVAHLLVGNYLAGWREFEWRSRSGERAPVSSFPATREPKWDGSEVTHATLLVHAEQGVGDTIQFIRYLPLARARSKARVLLHCQPEIAGLIASNAEDGIEIALQNGPPPPFDFQLSLMSLPYVLGLHEPMSPKAPYLRSFAAGVTNPSPGLRVGLVWAGAPKHDQDRHRSITVQRLQPILEVPGVTFHSLQLGQPSPAGVIDLTPHITDFADTAALMAELDLVITVDTAAAHLAGAVGRPVWTLLPFVSDWRWGLEGETTPWYPTMRLFRQPTRGDWDAVMQRVAGELAALAGQ